MTYKTVIKPLNDRFIGHLPSRLMVGRHTLNVDNAGSNPASVANILMDSV